MNNSTRTIAYIGMLTVVMLSMMSLFTLQQSPKVRELLYLSENIELIYGVDSVVVAQLDIPNGMAYKISFSPKQPLDAKEVERVMTEIGEHVWRKYREDKKLLKVIVLCTTTEGGKIEREIEPPQLKW